MGPAREWSLWGARVCRRLLPEEGWTLWVEMLPVRAVDTDVATPKRPLIREVADICLRTMYDGTRHWFFGIARVVGRRVYFYCGGRDPDARDWTFWVAQDRQLLMSAVLPGHRIEVGRVLDAMEAWRPESYVTTCRR